MRKKKDKKIFLIIILIAILGVLLYMYFNDNDQYTKQNEEENTTNTTTTTTESEVERRTIINTISSTGEIKTALDEKLELHATYYLEEIYVEEGDKVSEGENILKYTNGTYLVAPYNLVIVSLNLPDIGSQCTNSHNIEVYSINTLEIELKIDEEELEKVNVGQEVTITPSIDSSKTYTGYITNISNSGTYSSKGTTYTAKVTFENDENLKVGMSATANIILEKAENVIAVPKEAVTTNNNTKTVTIIENGTTKAVTVETGIENDAYAEIKSGLEEGQKIQITKQENNSNQNTNRNSNRNMQIR